MSQSAGRNFRSCFDRVRAEKIFDTLVPEAQWQVCAPLLEAASRQGLRFALGGGLAFSCYTGRLRNTKDLALYLDPADRQPFVRLMTETGFEEYTEWAYNRDWSYRGRKDDYLVDLIWGLLNPRLPVEQDWVSRGPEIRRDGVRLKLIPVEELIRSKLFILNRTRCDWPDLLTLIFACGPGLDWQHLLRRLGENAPVLGAVLVLF